MSNLAANLLHCWRCEDASTSLADVLGTASLPEITIGSPARTYQVTGKHNYCVQTALGGWQIGPSSAGWNPNDAAFACAGWVKLSSVTATHTFYVFFLAIPIQVSVQLAYDSGTSQMTFTVGTLSVTMTVDSAWHHWCFSVSSGTVTFWLDGTEIGNESISITLPLDSIGVGSPSLSGKLTVQHDEVGYWNRAFVQADVDDLYVAGGGNFYDFTGLKSHQMGAEVAYSANSASALTGLMAHQMAAEVAYSANGDMTGLMAHQLAAEVGYSPNGEVSGIIAHQLAAEVAFNPTRLYATGQPTTATWDVEAASPSPVLSATTATWDVEAVVVPVIATPTEASWSVDAAVPPISGSTTTAAWDVAAAYMGASGDPTTASWSVDAAVPPISGASTTATWDVDRILSNAIEAQSTTATWSVDRAVPPIGSATPAAAAWSVDKVWFREPPEFKYVFLTNILCQLGKTLRFKEETDNEITATIKDEHGHDLDSSDFDFVLLTLYDNASQTLLRPSEVVSGSLLTITAGALLWLLRPRDTDIVNDALRPPTPEKHTALIEFAHGTERTDALTDPFTTSSASNVITVTHPSHDLQLRDHVWFVAEETVGGLTLTGLFLVTNVIDADSYQVVAHRVATSTATGGGNVTAYRLGYSNKAEIVYEAAKSDVL